MNIPLKFRCWDVLTSKMTHLDPAKDDFHGGALQEQPGWKVMLFIGTADMNKKEIYSGDIVKKGNDRGEVVYEGTEFIVMGEIVDECCMNLLSTCKEIEIIGNIYENPELLN